MYKIHIGALWQLSIYKTSIQAKKSYINYTNSIEKTYNRFAGNLQSSFFGWAGYISDRPLLELTIACRGKQPRRSNTIETRKKYLRKLPINPFTNKTRF